MISPYFSKVFTKHIIMFLPHAHFSDIILTNLENDELRSFHFISGEEIYILKTVITAFYK